MKNDGPLLHAWEAKSISRDKLYGGGKGLERRGWVTTYVLPPYVDQLLLLLHLPCFVDTGVRPDVAELMMARLSNCPSVAPSFPPRQRVVLPPARIPPANPAVSQSVSQHPRQRAQRDPGLGGTTQHIQECHNTPTTTVTAATARNRGRHWVVLSGGCWCELWHWSDHTRDGDNKSFYQIPGKSRLRWKYNYYSSQTKSLEEGRIRITEQHGKQCI